MCPQGAGRSRTVLKHQRIRSVSTYENPATKYPTASYGGVLFLDSGLRWNDVLKMDYLMRPLLGKKRDSLARLARALERRQALPDALAVVLADEARVADHQHAAIAFVAD